MTTAFDTPSAPAVTLLPRDPKPDLEATHQRLGALFTRLATHRDERALLSPVPVAKKTVGQTVSYRGPGIHFTREGTTWSTSQADRRTVAAMLRSVTDIGKTPAVIQVRGTESFRRRSWLLGTAQGLKIEGYEPTARDKTVLTRLTERWQHRSPNHLKVGETAPQLGGSNPDQKLKNAHKKTLDPGFDPSSLTKAVLPKPRAVPAVIGTPGRGR